MSSGGAFGVLDSEGEPGNKEGRLSVSVRSCNWFASRIWVRVWGPEVWKRERNEAAMEAAGGSAKKRAEVLKVRGAFN